MTLSQDVLKLGRVGLFIGAGESRNWLSTQWHQSGDFMEKHKVNFALVKAFDAGNDWGTFRAAHTYLSSHGIIAVPYGFMGTADGYNYNLDRDLPPALALCKQYMTEFGLVCADMEGSGWSGRPDLGSMVAKELLSQSGLFLASVPANPVDAGMVDSFKTMTRVVDVWMPMAYSDYLGSVWRSQWERVDPQAPLAPTFDLSGEFGPNNVENECKLGSNLPQVSFWYYGFAEKDPGLLDRCVTALGSLPVQPPATAIWSEEALSLWNRFETTLSHTTGIARDWLERNSSGFYLGPPVSDEIDMSDGDTVIQHFTNAECTHKHSTRQSTWKK